MVPYLSDYLIIGGIALAIDGIGSIILQWKQDWTWHAERVARTAFGVSLVVLGLL